MHRDKTTASGIIFESAVQVMDDVIDFTIHRHKDDQVAMEIYAKMQAAMAESRRNLRRVLKRGWIKGKERAKCLARARELREAEQIIGYLIKTSRCSADLNSTVLGNLKQIPSMKELMSRFSIRVKGKRK